MNGWRLELGDCREVMRSLDAESVDAIVTDPPYGLGFMGKDLDAPGGAGAGDHPARRTDQANAVNTGVSKQGGRQRACDDFAKRQARDAAKFQESMRQWAVEALRVLKPGGHVVAFGGSRTYHRLACALEDAGFEIRDCLMWLYGQGFPKSLDVSKSIDKVGDESHSEVRREIVLRVTAWFRQARDARGLSNSSIDAAMGTNGMAGQWTSAASQPAVPTAEQWPKLLELLGVETPPADVRDAIDEWLKIKGQPAPTWSLREVTGHHEQSTPQQSWMQNYSDHVALPPKERRDIPATDEARQWQGWGTALKPGWEPIILARKPLKGTVASSVLEYGTGAINVDGCRIPTEGGSPAAARRDTARRTGNVPVFDCATEREGFEASGKIRNYSKPEVYTAERPGEALGRWPANVLLGHSALCGVARLVCIESPYAGAVDENTEYARRCVADSLGRGEFPIASHLLYTQPGVLRDEVPGERQLGIEAGLAWAESADTTVVYMDRGISSGMRAGIARALRDGRRVVLRWLDDPEKDDEIGCAADCPVRLLDEQSGERAPGNHPAQRRGIGFTENGGGSNSGTQAERIATEAGGASRFFYTAKATTAERNAGLDGFDTRVEGVWGGTDDDLSQGKKATRPRQNLHPTVKPVDLMQWLCRLVTPPGGTVLDPFAGSGSTVIAALREGFRCIGIEREPDYAAIARRRVEEDAPLFQRVRAG